jgi:hypothetical protein
MLSVMIKPNFACLQDDPAASAAVSASMEQLDFAGLLKQVDDGFRSWRKPR